MQKYIKTGILMLTLVVPVFIFLFLKFFSTNRFDLPYYVPLRDPVTQQVLMKQGDTLFYQIPDTIVHFQKNNTVITKELRGKTVVVSMQESPCDDTCQKRMQQLNRVVRLGEIYPDLRILTFTNEATETADEPLSTATSTWQVIRIADSLLAYLKNVFRFNSGQEEDKTISIYNRFQLIDASGYIRGYYNALDPTEVDRLLVEIKILEHNREPK